MKTRVELDPQVIRFVQSLAPEPRQLLRRALRGLQSQKGDLKQLEGELSGYCRLRVRGYRVVVRLYVSDGERVRTMHSLSYRPRG